MLAFSTILNIVRTATQEGPAFVALFNQVKTLFTPQEQAQLQSAYDQAMRRSDEAEDDFVKASRGQ